MEHGRCLVCFLNGRFYCGSLPYTLLVSVFPSLRLVPPETFQSLKHLCHESRAAPYIESDLATCFLVCLFFKMIVVIADCDWFILRPVRILFISSHLFRFSPIQIGKGDSGFLLCLSFLSSPFVGSAIGLSLERHREIARTLKRCSPHN